MKNRIKKLFFPFVGLAALAWFLIRVIPKPSRASYPCIRASMPLASSFVLYVISLTSSILFFKKARKFLIKARYALFTITMLLGITLSYVGTALNTQKVSASYRATTFLSANESIGEGKGIFPGRVAWVHNPDATNENCTNTSNDYWYMENNTNQQEVNKMLSDVLQLYSGAESDAGAWNAIFRNYNSLNNKGDVGYKAGEKIVIKINLNAYYYLEPHKGTNTSPQLCLALLEQLVNTVGVDQSDISIGDPNCPMTDITYNTCSKVFPNITYWGVGEGKSAVTPHKNAISWSNGDPDNALPQSYIDAAYMINVPVLKKHHRAGITLTAKNHFGSIAPFTGGAWHLHPSLPAPDASGYADNGSYGVYRCLVDIMGHKDLGGKTVLYLVDAIWSSTNWGHPPVKWRMDPFNNDWTNSLFVSQDPVAIESVAFDFLFKEFDGSHPTEGMPADGDKGPYAHFTGVDDYLLQAADPNYWPPNITYDPENDGTPLKSLGVHEHWNNANDKLYSRNLGANTGIELLSAYTPVSVDEQKYPSNNTFSLMQNHPNPFSEMTNISYKLFVPSSVKMSIYDLNGKRVKKLVEREQLPGEYQQSWDATTDNGSLVPAGVYVFTFEASNKNQVIKQSKSLIYKR